MGWLDSLSWLFPDGIIYGLTAIVFIVGFIKCIRPVMRNARTLKRATEMLKEGAKAKLSRKIWGDVNFLGKRQVSVWRPFLQSAEEGEQTGVMPDVVEYVNDDSMIEGPGRATLADAIPGICTSLGILGTFIGLSMGLTGLDVMEIDSYVQLTSGISFAFNTSIVGIIASLIFNICYRFATGSARDAVDDFTEVFYRHAIPRPADAMTQVVAYQREQAYAFSQFSEDMSVRIGGEIQHAISTSMAPVQRAMEDFLNAATRAQVDGLDYIVARFIDRMNKALEGQLQRLREALKETAEGQILTQEKLRQTVDAVGDISQHVIDVQGMSDEVIGKFSSYVGDVDMALRRVGETNADAGDLLGDIEEASQRQAKYLSALQEYQVKLQGSFQDYTVWTDKFVGGLEDRTQAQNASLEQVTLEMRASAELLRGAYQSFTEAIELGLANALGLFDENMQNLMKQVNGTLKEIQGTLGQMEGASKKADAKKGQGVT